MLIIVWIKPAFLGFTYSGICGIILQNTKGSDGFEDIKKTFCVSDVSCNVFTRVRLFHRKRSIYI